LTAEIYSERPGRAESFKRVLLETSRDRRETDVERLWFHDGAAVFKFAGIDSISDAEVWEGADVSVPAEQRLALDEGEYTHADLIGCAIVDEIHGSIGTVSRVEEYGGAPLLNVHRADGRELLIPFAKSICVRIDIATKTIDAVLPEGLADL